MEFKLYGRQVKEPRLVVVSYKAETERGKDPYMKRVKHYTVWDTVIQSLATIASEQILKDEGKVVEFGKAIINYYRDGKDYVAYHNDKDSMDSYIASYSFGHDRTMGIRPIGLKTVVTRLWLEDNSLMIMRPGMQQRYKHSILKCVSKKTGVKGRINVTFRVK